MGTSASDLNNNTNNNNTKGSSGVNNNNNKNIGRFSETNAVCYL